MKKIRRIRIRVLAIVWNMDGVRKFRFQIQPPATTQVAFIVLTQSRFSQQEIKGLTVATIRCKCSLWPLVTLAAENNMSASLFQIRLNY